MFKNFFKIVENDKYIVFYFAFIKIKFNKKYFIKQQTKTNENSNKENVNDYIQKYKYVLDLKDESIKQSYSTKYKNVIWTCWFQGYDKAPPIIQTAINTISTFNPTHKVIIITEKNLSKYVKLPSFIKEKYEKKIISKTHLSDYLRILLLQKYGGIGVDASCYFTDKIPNEIWNSSFFQFKNIEGFSLKNIPTNSLGKLIYRYAGAQNFVHTGSNGFLQAKPNNPIIVKMRHLLEEYWKNENTLIDYFIFHYFLAFLIKNCRGSWDYFNKMPYINNIYPHLLQNAFDDEFDENTGKEICKNSFVHKLKGNFEPEKYQKQNNFLNFLLNKAK